MITNVLSADSSYEKLERELMRKRKRKLLSPEEICPMCHSAGIAIESYDYDYKCTVCESQWDASKENITFPTTRGDLNFVLEYFYEKRDELWGKLGPIGGFLLSVADKFEELMHIKF